MSMKSSEFTVIIPSHRPELAREAGRTMSPIEPVYRLNKGYPSFSKLINDCILSCQTEIVIICNDKIRPTAFHEYTTSSLVRQGYGFVALHNFRHFGFHKDLIRRIGFFDERYEGGEYEDFDFLRRIKEANIAIYMSKEIPCLELSTSWNNQKSKEFNFKKWKEWGTHTTRILPDEPARYDLGPYTGTFFKEYSKSQLKNIDTPKEFIT